MRVIIFLLSLLLSNFITACDCVIPPFALQYQNSDFIAKVKVLSVSLKSSSAQFQEIQIEIMSLYKGLRTKTIEAENPFITDCGVNIYPTSIWLVFAKKDSLGTPKFNSCSGSIEISNINYDSKFPNYKNHLQQKLSLTITLLEFLKKGNIDLENQSHINFILPKGWDTSLQTIKIKSREFALFKLKFTENNALPEISNIKIFSDKIFTRSLIKLIEKGDLKELNSIEPSNSHKTKYLYLLLFYYPSEQNNKGFLSFNLL
ncbi:MAG: hypothetical protein U0X40_00865 [Ferruginibacter sp.]